MAWRVWGMVLVASALAAAGCAAESSIENDDGAGAFSGTGGDGGMTSGMGGTATTTSTTMAAGGMGAMGGGGGAGGMDPCAMGCPMGFWDIDDNPLTGECGCEYACEKLSEDDPIDGMYSDDNCDGGDGVVEQCVYVSASLGSPTGAGTRQDPVDTIADGIAAAVTSQVPSVCVSGEFYGESVAVVSGISVYGGFDHLDPNFAFIRSPNVTTIVETTGTVFFAENIDDETHVEGFTINALTPPGTGASTYGVRRVGGNGHLFVRYNVINAGPGSAGSSGVNGNPPAQAKAPNGIAGTNGCQGSSCGYGGPPPSCAEFGGKGGDGGYDSGTGQNGSPGTANAPVGSGASSSSCLGGGNDGGPGSPAPANNSQGTPGGGAAPLGTIAGGLYVGAAGTAGQPGPNGKGGSGGGGGGGGNDIGGFICNSDKGGGGGSGGCGGLGGNNGLGGQGGGGSFGVFATGGTITVTSNTITTSAGGAGGKGGNGAAGQAGGSGGAGGAGNDDAGSGGHGGNGSKGGAGGPGGGGGGGPSTCLGYAFSVTHTYQSNSCTTGLPGVGGAVGTNPQNGTSAPGSNGAAAPTLQIN